MSRGLWFVAGAGAGVYAAFRARRVAEILTVEGLQDRVGAAVVGARLFRDEVAQGRAESETGLRERMGLALHDLNALEAPPPAGTPPTLTSTDRHHDKEAGSS